MSVRVLVADYRCKYLRSKKFYCPHWSKHLTDIAYSPPLPQVSLIVTPKLIWASPPESAVIRLPLVVRVTRGGSCPLQSSLSLVNLLLSPLFHTKLKPSLEI